MDEVVISFFETIITMIKYPDAERLIRWRMMFFDQRASKSTDDPDISIMNEELMLCKKRRRSRKSIYNASDIEYVLNSYYISGSTKMISSAWDLFRSGRYKI